MDKQKTHKSLLFISYSIKITLIVAIIGAVFTKQYHTLFFSILTLTLGLIPPLLQKNYKINLPLEFELIISIFIFSTLFLGEVGNYYEKFWWWDILLHTFSGMIIGMIGFLIVYILNSQNKIHLHLNPIFIAIFSFSFALSIGAIWEIFEYAMDSFFGLNMQKSGLVDTMGDLIVDSIGAIIISIAGYYYTKKVKVPFFDSLINKFTKQNPSIFKKKKNS